MGMLDGRVAVVTGAGRGIGAGVAKLFAAQGAAVVVNDLGVELDGSGRDAGPAHQVVAEIRAAGGRATASTADVTDDAAARSLVRQAIDEFGKLDVLVTAAGILRDRMVFNMTGEEWDAVIRVHLRGTFNATHHAAAYWRALQNPAGHHRLITFTSTSGLHGAPGQPNYAAAKMGIVGFTYSCANALSRYGVTANSISPGAATRMTASVPQDRRRAPAGGKAEGDSLPNPTLPREGGGGSADERAPEHVAPAVVYLASDRSDWLTGQVIQANGYQVGLYDRPHVIRQVVSRGPWELEHLFDLMEKSFRPALEVQGAQPRPPQGVPAGPGA